MCIRDSKRAATWEGERQFKLYLLFIHELTIGNSKKADFRKEACKAVLEAIDQTPEDHSVLDWCKFYPELAIYKYHEELLKMELDGLVIWKRTIHNENLLNELSSLKLFKNNKVKESLSLISKNSNNYYVSKYYNNISEESIFNNNLFDAREYIEKSLNYARKIEDALKRDPRIASICKTLVRLGLKKDSKNLLKGIKSPFFIKGELTIMNSFSKISIDNGDIVGSLEYHDKIDKNYLGRMNSLLYIYDRIVDKELAYDKLNILSKMSNLINEVNEIIKVETKEKTIWKRSPVFVPSFHVYNGLYLKRKGDEDSAHQEFESALSLVKNMKREGSILPSYLKLRSIFLEFSDHKRASEVMDIAYSFYATIGDENKNKIKAFDQLISIEVENNKIDSALKLIQNTNIGSCKENGFQKLGQILSFMDLQNFLNHFTIGEYSNFLINGFSKKLLSSSKFNLEINPYLHNYSENTQNLSNILFHKAKMACFFEEERNEEKLNMLSEVLDIKDWRMMSA